MHNQMYLNEGIEAYHVLGSQWSSHHITSSWFSSFSTWSSRALDLLAWRGEEEEGADPRKLLLAKKRNLEDHHFDKLKQKKVAILGNSLLAFTCSSYMGIVCWHI